VESSSNHWQINPDSGHSRKTPDTDTQHRPSRRPFTTLNRAMPQSFPSLPALLDHGYDTVIDVRSPAEYAHDHIPGAISLPALTNDERAEVGTIYKQISAFSARKIGAAMVARNVATHLEGPLAAMEGAGVRWSIAGAAGNGPALSPRS